MAMVFAVVSWIKFEIFIMNIDVSCDVMWILTVEIQSHSVTVVLPKIYLVKFVWNTVRLIYLNIGIKFKRHRKTHIMVFSYIFSQNNSNENLTLENLGIETDLMWQLRNISTTVSLYVPNVKNILNNITK